MIINESLKTGIVAGFLGSLCCTTPIIIVALGLGSIGFALSFVKYRPFFVILGLVFVSFALYRQIKLKHGTCSISIVKRSWPVIVVALITALIIWVLLIYVIAPFLGRFVYG